MNSVVDPKRHKRFKNTSAHVLVLSQLQLNVIQFLTELNQINIDYMCQEKMHKAQTLCALVRAAKGKP